MHDVFIYILVNPGESAAVAINQGWEEKSRVGET